MASPCVVQFCDKIGNHRFPQNELMRSRWIEAIKIVKPGLTIRKSSLICSSHFTLADFISPSIHLPKLPRGMLYLLTLQLGIFLNILMFDKHLPWVHSEIYSRYLPTITLYTYRRFLLKVPT